MTVMTSVIPHGRPFTVDDLEGMPDDGNRYELIDGMLHVSPCPVPRHQVVAGELFFLLRLVCPPGLLPDDGADGRPARPGHLSCSRTCWSPGRPTSARRTCPSRRSSRSRCCHRRRGSTTSTPRRSAYEKMGVASYWIVDPNESGALTAFELDEHGTYRQVAHVEGDEDFAATRPFPVTVVPARLLDGLRPR